MTAKEALHQLVDDLPEDQTDLARLLLQDLHGGADLNGRLSMTTVFPVFRRPDEPIDNYKANESSQPINFHAGEFQTLTSCK